MNDERLEEGQKRPPGASRNGWLMMLFGWSMAFFLVTFFYWSLLDHQSNPNRMSVISRQGGDLVLEKNDSNQYVAEGLINGIKVVFLLDTGATHIAVPSQVAERANLSRHSERAIQTAAGEATGYSTRISSVQLGPFLFRDIRGLIIPDLSMQEDVVLLGMNALGGLSFSQEDGRLTIKIPDRKET